MMKYLTTKMIRNEMDHLDRDRLQPARIYAPVLLVESNQLLLTKRFLRKIVNFKLRKSFSDFEKFNSPVPIVPSGDV